MADYGAVNPTAQRRHVLARPVRRHMMAPMKRMIVGVTVFVGLAAGAIAMSRMRHVPRPAASPECSPDDGDIRLPSGFCASIFADTVGVARHLLVAPNGDVIVS